MVLEGVLFGVLLLRNKLLLMTGLWQGHILMLSVQMWLVEEVVMTLPLPCRRGGGRVKPLGDHLGELLAARRMMN